MNEQNVKIFCPRCGSEMNSNSRYCLKCGYLNPTNSANQGMQQYIANNGNSLYQVGEGKMIQNSNGITNSIATNTGNKMVCFLINYLIYIFIIIISFIFIMKDNTIGFNSIKNSLFPYVAFSISTIFLYVYSMQLIFMKANKEWWYALIPFYNLFVLSDIAFKKKWLGILLLIPFVGQVFFLVIMYVLGTKFKYSGLLALLLPVIYIPLMGFGSRFYEGINYLSEDRTLEKDYKRKKVFFISIMFFLIFGAVLMFWTNIIEMKTKAVRLKNYYYVFATKQIVDKTKKLAKENYLECEKYDYKKDSGVYYIWYSDIGDVAFIPFHSIRNVMYGYVIIDNSSGSSKYYVSLSDDNYGYPETLYDDIKVETIVPYEKVVTRSDINICINKKPKVTVGEM